MLKKLPSTLDQITTNYTLLLFKYKLLSYWDNGFNWDYWKTYINIILWYFILDSILAYKLIIIIIIIFYKY